MKTKQNYSPSIRILSHILSLLIAFYLIPTSVYAEMVDNAPANINESGSESGNEELPLFDENDPVIESIRNSCRNTNRI